MASVRLQQFDHSFIGAARLAGQGPAHRVLHVVVTDGNGIGIAYCSTKHEGRRPDADPAEGCHALIGLFDGHGSRLFKPIHPSSGIDHDVGSLPLDTMAVKGVIGQRGQCMGRRADAHRFWPRCVLAKRANKASPAPVGFDAGDLLFKDHLRQVVPDQSGSPDPKPVKAAVELGDDVVVGFEC